MPQIYHYEGAAPKQGAAPYYVMLASPVGHRPVAAFARSLAATADTLTRFGIRFDIHLFEGGCHVDDARNYIIRHFLQGECTDLFFLDDDMGWQAKDVVRLIQAPGDIVGGVYPHKNDAGTFPFHPGMGKREANEHGLFEMPKIATGFMRIRREVLQKLYDEEIEKGRYSWMSSDDVAGNTLPAARIVERGFPRELDLKDVAETDDYQSGDYVLCLKARRAGFKCWIYPDMAFAHCGMKAWVGHFGNHLREQQGVPLPNVVEAIADLRSGKDGVETFQKLAANNDGWPLGWSALHQMWHQAKATWGNVLECGSGVSTMVLGLALEGTDRKVYTLEHDPHYWQQTARMLEQHQIGNVDVNYVPLEPYEDGTAWYAAEGMDLPDRFGFALIDGPPRQYGGRQRVLEVFGDKLKQAVLLVDDVMSEKALIASLKDHEAELVQCEKSFAIARPKSQIKAVAAE